VGAGGLLPTVEGRGKKDEMFMGRMIHKIIL
jgi:hypothetical protein